MKQPPKVHNMHHGTAPEGAVYIGRGSPYGNPFVIGRDGSRDEVINLFEKIQLPKISATDMKRIRGKHLLCFCKPAACHGDILLREANK